jgi:hypothetical protein
MSTSLFPPQAEADSRPVGRVIVVAHRARGADPNHWSIYLILLNNGGSVHIMESGDAIPFGKMDIKTNPMNCPSPPVDTGVLPLFRGPKSETL